MTTEKNVFSLLQKLVDTVLVKSTYEACIQLEDHPGSRLDNGTQPCGSQRDRKRRESSGRQHKDWRSAGSHKSGPTDTRRHEHTQAQTLAATSLALVTQTKQVINRNNEVRY